MMFEVLPGLFLEVFVYQNEVVGSRFTREAIDRAIPPFIGRHLERFFSAWRQGFHDPLPDDLLSFPPALVRWQPLLVHLKNTIAPGETITYGDLGAPFGIHPRAVGQAMARNVFPFLIPCHRVVGAGGRLTGFSGAGGIDTKQRLLAFEQGCRLSAVSERR